MALMLLMTAAVANAQSFVQKDMSFKIPVFALKIDGDVTMCNDEVEATVRYRRMTGGNTLSIELNGKTEELRSVWNPKNFSIYMSGADVNCLTDGTGTDYTGVRGRNPHLYIVQRDNDGEWVIIVDGGVETGLYVGMPKAEVERVTLDGLPRGSKMALTKQGADYKVYTLYSYGANAKPTRSYGDFYFDKNNKLIKWLRK